MRNWPKMGFIFVMVTVVLTVLATNRGAAAGAAWSAPETAFASPETDAYFRDGDGAIHLVSAGYHDELHYAHRFIGGGWTSDYLADIDVSRYWLADIVATGDRVVHIIYGDKAGGANHLLYYTWLNSAGVWSTPVRISELDHDVEHISLIVGANQRVYAIWSSMATPGLYLRYTDGGGVWSDREQVDDGTMTARYPAVVLDEAMNLHFFWFGQSTSLATRGLYHRQLSSQHVWGDDVLISDQLSSTSVLVLKITPVYGDGRGYVTWTTTENGQTLYFAEFNGSSWQNPVTVNGVNGLWYPVYLGVHDGQQFLLAGEDSADTFTLWTRQGSGSWVADPALTFMDSIRRADAQLSGIGELYVVWDNYPTGEVQGRVRDGSGVWSATQIIGSNSGATDYLTIEPGGLFLDFIWSGNDAYYSFVALSGDYGFATYLPLAPRP